MEVEYWGAVLKRIVIHKARITVGAIDSQLRQGGHTCQLLNLSSIQRGYNLSGTNHNHPIFSCST